MTNEFNRDALRAIDDRDDEFDEDDIEILEVIGLDDDSPFVVEAPDAVEDADEVVLEIDGDAVGDPARGDKEYGDREQLLRVFAEFENFKKRVDREREAAERHATAALVLRLLPVLDNFERALGRPPNGPDSTFHDGVALIFRQLLDELRRDGLTAIDSVGETFDPAVHEAVATTTDSGIPSHTIVEELQRGYLLHDRLLRPALVKVAIDGTADDSRGTGEDGDD